MRINSFIAPEQMSGDEAVLSPEESHHLARVLRVEAGQEITLFDGTGNRATAVITGVSKKSVTVRVTARETVPPPAVNITLIQAVSKPDRFETVLQKAAELGVHSIIPAITAHTVFKSNDQGKQAARWRSIILNACQQSSAAWMPQLCAPEKISKIIPVLKNFDVAFIASLYPGARRFRDVLSGIGKNNFKHVALLIGPEGDFTEEETAGAVNAGAIPVSFGTQILRTETAAIFGLSVLVYELF
ncbi:MAG: RsmE family RNA methyltransferase [Kiritimatiellales bacterium]